MVTQVVIRATESFNLHCNNVARHIEEKCCPFYRTFKSIVDARACYGVDALDKYRGAHVVSVLKTT